MHKILTPASSAHWRSQTTMVAKEVIIQQPISRPTAGLEITTNTVTFVTNFFPLRLKCGETANLQLVFTLALSK